MRTTAIGTEPAAATVALDRSSERGWPSPSSAPGDGAWRVALAVLFGLGLCLFAYAWAVSPARPGVSSVLGWKGWQDQSAYLNEARALSHGRLPGSAFLFGPAWPATGAVWLRLGVSDPFVVTDALAFATSLVLTAILGRRLRSAAFGLAVAGALAVGTPLLLLMVQPWNTTVTLLSVLVLLVVGTSGKVPSPAAGAWVGAAVGVAFAARYIDGPLLIPLAGWVLLSHGRKAIRATAVAVLVAGAFVLPVLAAQDAAFGSPLRTPYINHPGPTGTGSEQATGSWSLGRIPRSFVEVFVTGSSQGVRQPEDPIVARFPWALLAPAGAYALIRQRHRLRGIYLVALTNSMVAVLIYCSFRAVVGAQLKFENIHYFKAWFPLWALLAAEATVAAATSLVGARRIGAS